MMGLMWSCFVGGVALFGAIGGVSIGLASYSVVVLGVQVVGCSRMGVAEEFA